MGILYNINKTTLCLQPVFSLVSCHKLGVDAYMWKYTQWKK